MKHSKKIIGLCLFILLLPACNKHTHTFADTWSYDINSHWHPATCEHKDQVKDKVSHTFVEGRCTVCNYLNPNYEGLKDTDYDGLYDNVDPNVSSNEYDVQFKAEADLEYSKPIHIKVDYRDFIFDDVPELNETIAQIGSMLVLDSYYKFEKAYFLNDVYHCADSDVFNLYGQFGITNARYETVVATQKYDSCGLFLGNHKLSYNDKVYQFFFVTIRGYSDTQDWTSNFDFGADIPEYYGIFGDDPYWKNKDNHKGFDATANAALPKILAYMEEFKDPSCEQYLYCQGQSRGASITNILGKYFADLNLGVKSAFCCFNPALSVANSNEEYLESYKNIITLYCREDIVSKVPPISWGFDNYGIKYQYSPKDHVEYFNSISNVPFQCFKDSTIITIVNTIEKLSSTREKYVQYRDIDNDNNLEIIKNLTKEEAIKKVEELENFTEDFISKDSVKAEMYLDPNSLLGEKYCVQIYTRPCIVTGLINQILPLLNKDVIEKLDTEKLQKILDTYKPVLPRYINNITNFMTTLLTEEGSPLDIYHNIMSTHGPLTTVITCKFAEKMS